MKIVQKLIWIYRICFSPFLGKRCRFHPSCSEYAQESLKKHGFLMGSWNAFYRIMRCNPFHPGGYDPA